MGARSSAPPEDALAQAPAPPRPFTFGRLVIGILLVALVVGPLILAVARLRQPPDPGRLVYLSGRDVVVRDLADGSEHVAATTPHGVRFPVLRPDGEQLAYLVGPGEMETIDVRGGGRKTTRVPGRPVSWTPNGKLMFQTHVGTDTKLVVAEDGDTVKRITPLSLIPPGRWRLESEPVWLERDVFAVAVRDGSGPGELQVVDVGDGKPRIVHRILRGRPLVGSPNGRQLLFTRGTASGDATLELLSVRHLESEPVARGLSFAGAAISRRGLVAIWGQQRSGDSAVWLLNPASTEFEVFLGEGGIPLDAHVAAAAWSADGSHLLFLSDDQIRSVHVDGSDLKTLAQGARGGAFAVARWR